MAQQRAYIFIGDDAPRQADQSHLQTTEEQLELFMIKYSGMDRDSLKYIAEVQ
jgi:hypothetical protein